MKDKIFLLIICFACSYSLDAFERHIAVSVRNGMKGEFYFATRLESACRNIDWQIDIFDIENCDIENKSYDFVINLVPGAYKKPNCKNYMALFHPEHHYFDMEGHLAEPYRFYDGYLITYPFDMFKDPFPCMRWYPTVHQTEFQIVEPRYIFHICAAWGNRLSDPKFQHLLNLLDKEPFVHFYGNPYFGIVYPKSFQGEIPYDSHSLFQVAAQDGVTLILHSAEHNRLGLPSGRIFEAAASSTVIISDDNSFVKDNFGDSVLYIDTTVDASSIFQQIQDHWNWIQQNQTEALRKAKQAHFIYREHFLLEDQLLKLGEYHDQISNAP